MRSMTPDLPDHPVAEQVEAWVELAELSQNPDFRASVRYLQLLAVINDWAAPESLAPVFDRFIQALRARIPG
jgi:primosomal protein N'